MFPFEIKRRTILGTPCTILCLGHPVLVCYENGIAGFKNKYQKLDAENCPESWPPMMSDVSGLNQAS